MSVGDCAVVVTRAATDAARAAYASRNGRRGALRGNMTRHYSRAAPRVAHGATRRANFSCRGVRLRIGWRPMKPAGRHAFLLIVAMAITLLRVGAQGPDASSALAQR